MAPNFHAVADDLTPRPGAYVLLIELADPTPVKMPGRPDMVLPPGRYLYCGSARGPGGIKARVGRHMRRDKVVRWHVDQLTTAGRVGGAWVFEGESECTLVAKLAELPVPIPGFGATDCKTCESHLLAWPAATPCPWPWVSGRRL